MKINHIYSLLVALLCLMTGCSSDNLLEQDNRSSVSFRISIPCEMGTRSEEVTPQYILAWTLFAVNEGEGKETKKYVDSDSCILDEIEDELEINLNLAKGAVYKIIFCAYNADSDFASFDERQGVISIDYSKASVIQSGDDMFVGSYGPIHVEDGVIDKTIALTRPFALLNWASKDLDAPTVTPYLKDSKAHVSVSGDIYTSLDLFDNSLSSPINGHTFPEFDCNNLTTETISMGNDDAKYVLLASNLLLTGTESSTLNCEMKFSGNVSVTASVDNTSVAPDFKTNIYGSLITDPANITVNLAPYSAINPIIIHTAAEFVKRILAGEDVEVPEGETIDLSGCNEIALSDGQTLTVNGTLLLENEQIKIRDGNEATIIGTGLIKSASTSDSNLIGAVEGGILNISNVSIENYIKTSGKAAVYADNGTLKINNVSITSSNADCVSVINGSNLKIDSSKLTTKDNIFLTKKIFGQSISIKSCSKAEVNDCIINSQSGIEINNASCYIKDSNIKTESITYDGSVGYNHCFYLRSNASLIINGGKYYTTTSYVIYKNSGAENVSVDIQGGQFNRSNYFGDISIYSIVNVSDIFSEDKFECIYEKDSEDGLSYWVVREKTLGND